MNYIILIIYLLGFLWYWKLYDGFIRASGLAIASAVVRKKKNSMVAEVHRIYSPNKFFSLLYLPLIFICMVVIAVKKIYSSPELK